MELFTSHGYEKTTMRAIAECAGVNVAVSYRYFPSKEHLVLEFYRHFTVDFITRADEAIRRSHKLEDRLIAVAEAMFDAAGPYHEFAGSLFATAASPTSPLNPFSEPFTDIRRDGIDLFAQVIDGCSPRPPVDVAAELPFLLWTFNLGLMYAWLHDHSENQDKTRVILHQSVRLIVGLLRLSGLPGARHFRRQALSVATLVRASLPTHLAAPE